MHPEHETDDDAPVKEARLWRDNGWTATVIKNEDDDGWAVAMTRQGEAEPALVGPWTMGRDKKNPKPLDTAAFNTLVKTASEVIRRHEQQRHALLHRQLTVETADGPVLGPVIGRDLPGVDRHDEGLGARHLTEQRAQANHEG